MRGLREQLVERMRAAGVLGDPAIARAFRRVPRHRFVPEVTEEQAYADEVVPTKRDQNGHPISSASQPSMVALMLRQLDLRPGLRVLEIGAGTGYNAALLSELVGTNGQVSTVDIDADTVRRATYALRETGYRAVRIEHADGGHGLPEFAPYDRIVVTAGAADLPPAWWHQLADGGLLVVPLRLSGLDVSIAFRRRAGATSAADRLVSRSLVSCGFMPMRGAFGARGDVLRLPEPGIHAVREAQQPAAQRSAEQIAEQPAEQSADQASEQLEGQPDGRTADIGWLRDGFGRPGPLRQSGVSATVGEVLHGLGLWLATTDPACCRLELDPEVVRAGTVRSPLLARSGAGRVAGLLESNGLAVLAYLPIAPKATDATDTPDGGTPDAGITPEAADSPEQRTGRDDPPGCPIDDLDVRVELGVVGYGPRGPEVADRLMTNVREWRRRGVSGPERMRVIAVPADTPIQQRSDVLVLDKPHCRLLIRWL